MLGCRWYAELPQEGTGVAARPLTAVPAVHMGSMHHMNFAHMSSAHMNSVDMSAVHMTTTPGSKSTRSFINDHKIGRPRVPGGPTG